MRKLSVVRSRRDRKAGLPPGTPVYIGEGKTEKIRVTVIDYDENQVLEKEIGDVGECLPFKDKKTVTWINVDGIHEVDVIESLGRCFDLHPLIIEDIANTEQRPKLEDYDKYLFIVLKMITYEEKSNNLQVEQVCLVLGDRFVISFQEQKGDIFDSIRSRIRNNKGRIRKMGADFLAYTIMDTIVDHYFFILEKLGEIIEDIEDTLVADPQPQKLQEIHRLKREMILLRKSVWPLRELINGMERGESALVRKETQVFLRDVYDHTIQVIDTVETYRDMIAGMHDTYLSSISNRMNQIMKVLTIIATIFIPLTFIAGIYGMNFKFMPELEWRWGYLFFWGVILVIAVLMLVQFRRKKWL